MKKIILTLLVSILCISLIGCSNFIASNTKTVDNIAKSQNEVNIYGEKDSKKVKELLKSFGKTKDLSIEKATEKDMVVIDNKEIVANKKLWEDFYNNSQKNIEDSVIIVKYTEQDDPILTYVSYVDQKYYMIEDESRNRYNEIENKDYYEYSFKYLREFEDNYFKYVYLLDDKDITLDELNYTLLSNNEEEWIKYGFVFYINK